jgi:hypothetical protein
VSPLRSVIAAAKDAIDRDLTLGRERGDGGFDEALDFSGAGLIFPAARFEYEEIVGRGRNGIRFDGSGEQQRAQFVQAARGAAQLPELARAERVLYVVRSIAVWR